ncbi:SDR family oxidoreductase [Actinacidiphila glaucinigra]|uniref:SDR family NAD(P)-dependent oxidoreductase n=1 Tax=Actinacidiphila glaucinigra TaxID=235986 RepID=UPI002DD84BAA|nr:SDR family oxidoreductase [Actinacidiphila glaucinigra]WSD57486.1 SDR family oxidoreductase [Actinacidiphila glaucinigra]WSD65159.1 SDR family oxidoreductase [Actinacidiphila glaucinigra]
MTNNALDGLPTHPLAGKTAVVTGGGRGIGASTALLLARAGARLALVGRREESMKALADSLPDTTVVIPADLSRPEAPEAVWEALIAQLGQVDVLVNNAGQLGSLTPAQDMTAEEADALWALNTRAPLLLGAKAAAHMASVGGGSIVNVTSAVGSDRSMANVSLYATTKGAVDALTLALAAEWGTANVRVNAVRPAVARTDFSRAVTENPALEEMLTKEYVLGRLGEPEDIAQAILFFASPASSYVTGQLLSVDGGWGSVHARG